MSGQTELDVLRREWHAARQYALHLRHGGPFPELTEYSVSIDLPEPVAFRTIATCERRLAGTGRVPGTSRASPRQRARMAGWGDPQSAAVVATGSGLVLNSRLGGWQSLPFAVLVDFDADLSTRPWSVQLALDGAEALRLSGVSAPLLAVHVAAGVRPAGWFHHPAIQQLLDEPAVRRRRSPSRKVAGLRPPTEG